MAKKKKKIFIFISAIIGVLFVFITGFFIFLLFLSPGKIKTRGNNLILAEKIFIDIGGISQGMIIESTNISNPVLLFLHGGPGSTEYASFKHYNVGLENLFTVCYWEQRGAGLSYSPDIDKSTMNLNQLINDTIEVTNYLQNRFKQEKIFIMGHSWGTFLGSHVINKNPELYHAYIGVGQVVNTVESEKEIYNFMYSTAISRNDNNALNELNSWNINNELTFKNGEYLGMRMKYVLKYGGGISRNETSMLPFLMQIFFCRAYTIKEKFNFIKGSTFSGMNLLHYVTDADLLTTFPKQEIPVYILAGKHDYQTTFNQAKMYYEYLDAPDKAFYVFENSAHSPMFDEPILFIEIIKEIIRSY